MDDLISKKRAVNFLKTLAHEPDMSDEGATAVCMALSGIDKMPIIDARAVIRCADCAYYGKSPFGHPHIGWCRIDCKHRKPDFFCANADRK